MRILIAEDDDSVGEALVDVLGAHGHQPSRVSRGADVLLRHSWADVVLLDLGLPDGDGLDVLRKLRQVSEVPLLVVTARGDERSVVRGLRLGADDYLVKPVRLGELLARIDVVVTRRARSSVPAGVVEVDDVVIDLTARRVRAGEREITLTPKEFDLLGALARRAGAAVSREVILDELWGDAFLASSRALDVHLAQLRVKLSRPGLITTIRGFGYRLGA
ncbi:response regulator transcription factor [Kribbella sp. HUAS MG21]|jgi:DNA-binding response OmpR family regulator|uniref:Response regulator transcription factor n=1 Tax=Kribbella sp. HUAS MG21 TaxID=3160966 RepID=A0AAU7T8Q0_9ACTN